MSSGCPEGVDRTSGSRPRLPIRITLLTMRPFSSALESVTVSQPSRRPSFKVGTQEREKVRLILQRVSEASVTVEDEAVGKIGPGLLVFVGIERGDGPGQIKAAADKLAGLRVFEDEAGKMNLDL